MKVSRIHRLLRLITLLQSGSGWTADELARELDVSRRTVFRDMNMLEMAHIPYYFDRERGSYRLGRHFFLPPVNLEIGEALSLLLLAARHRPSTSLPWLDQAGAAAMKLESVLPATVREHVGSVLSHIEYRPAATAHHDGVEKTMHELAQAVARRRECKLVYTSFYEGRQTRVTVKPYRLVFIHRAWYLLAGAGKEIRTYKLARIKSMEVTGETFPPTDGRRLDNHFGQAWSMIPEGRLYDVHLRFAPQVAGNVAEVQWHGSQQVQWCDDGSLDFRVRVDGLGEIFWWILGYGDRVCVQSPAALRQRVREMAGNVAALYAVGEG